MSHQRCCTLWPCMTDRSLVMPIIHSITLLVTLPLSPYNFTVEGSRQLVLRTCYDETGVMDFGL